MKATANKATKSIYLINNLEDENNSKRTIFEPN